MADPYLGEIRTVGFAFAPTGWAMCNGQTLPVAQNTALFSLLGATYGGDGISTFALPNLNGNFVIGSGQGPGLSQRDLGETGGSSVVTLNVSELPAHRHTAMAVAAPGDSGDPQGRTWAEPQYGRAVRDGYSPRAAESMEPDAFGSAGGSQSHNNMPPYLGMYYVIALRGVYPPRG